MQAQQNSFHSCEVLSKAEKSEVAALFHSGKAAETEEKARILTQRYPADVFGWNVLGMVFLQQGKSQWAVPNLQQAISLSPRESDIHNNLGVALLQLGRMDEAVASFRKAAELKPESTTARNNLGRALDAAGRTEEAAATYRESLAMRPDQPGVLYNLGNILKDAGRLDEAAASYRTALEYKPDYAQAMTNLGLVQSDRGYPDEAESFARRALLLEPGMIEALNLLAALRITQKNDAVSALPLIVRSLGLAECPETRRLFAECLQRVPATLVAGPVREFLERALTEPWTRPSGLVSIGVRVLREDARVGACMARANAAWPRRLAARELHDQDGLSVLESDRLLSVLLDAAPVCTIEMERFLTQARHAMLDAIDPDRPGPTPVDTAPSFHAALARQCGINEYVFEQTEDESRKAQTLRDALLAALEADRAVPMPWVVAVAAYFPLGALPGAERLLASAWPEPVTALLDQQIREPEQERLYRATIPRLTPIKDRVSLLVQRQYEENPYPRWVRAAPAPHPLPFDDALRQEFPLADIQSVGRHDRLDILIAGCGTGQHSLETARHFQGARVLAIDLSLSSLAYAKRKTLELGVTTIEYAQADIIGLGDLGRTFDVIESSGVLHHLADPFAGWRVLLGLLRPRGCMRLGFYSKSARRHISRIRSLIADNGDPPTPECIRARRQEIMVCQQLDDVGNLLLDDFFSLSGCRDLFFHVQEHCLTINEIKGFVTEHSLNFLGFEINPQILKEYRQRFPGDRAGTNLSNWHQFEVEHPDTFIEMYQFWVQKAG